MLQRVHMSLEIAETCHYRLMIWRCKQAASTDLRLGDSSSQSASDDSLLRRPIWSRQAAGPTILVHICAPDVDSVALCCGLIAECRQVQGSASFRPACNHSSRHQYIHFALRSIVLNTLTAGALTTEQIYLRLNKEVMLLCMFGNLLLHKARQAGDWGAGAAMLSTNFHVRSLGAKAAGCSGIHLGFSLGLLWCHEGHLTKVLQQNVPCQRRKDETFGLDSFERYTSPGAHSEHSR